MLSPSATPTPITPPRVPIIDPRTGLIDRAWYMFFLSLLNAAQVADDSGLGPSTESLIATYDAALQTLAQTVGSAPAVSYNELEKQIQALAVNPPPAEQVFWYDVISQPHIEAYDLSASIALTSTPTLLIPANTVAGASGITYDNTTGVFTFSNAGSYGLSLFVNAISSAANQFVYIYAEKNNGAGWTVNPNSGKYYELVNGQATQIAYANSVYRNANEQVRYYIYSNDGKVTLTTQTLPVVTPTVYVPAIRIQYS